MGVTSLREICYKVSRPLEFSPNSQAISMCYMPIIGVQALSLYNFLINDSDIQASIPSVRFMHSRIAQSIGVAIEQIELLRAKLEGMGLLATYVDGRDPAAPVIFYELRQPLGAFAFIDTPRYRALLEQKIGAAELEKTFFALRQSLIPGSAVNVSSTFDGVFASEITLRQPLDQNKLETYVQKRLSINVQVGTAALAVINRLYTEGSITFEQAGQLVGRSAERIDGQLVVHNGKLSERIAAMTDFSSVPTVDSESVRRDSSVFTGGCEAQVQLLVMESYKKKNAELYLSQLQSGPLSCKQRDLLNKLRVSMKLADETINVLVDFAAYRSRGRLNEEYLISIAKSLNLANVKNAHEAVLFFKQILSGGQKRETARIERPITGASVLKKGTVPSWVNEYDPAKGQSIS